MTIFIAPPFLRSAEEMAEAAFFRPLLLQLPSQPPLVRSSFGLSPGANLPSSRSLLISPHNHHLAWEMNMRDSIKLVGLLLFSTLMLTGCQAIADIFRAGFWVGAIVILLVALLVMGIVMLARRK
jgi:hypothetical protein